MSVSYTANMRCMSPLDAFPVPLVGSKPLLSVGSRTVSVPPARGGSVTVPGDVVVVCSWFWGLASVVLLRGRTLVLVVALLDGLVVDVDADCSDAVVLVVFSSGAGVVVEVSRGTAGSGLRSGSVTVLAFLAPPLHAA